MINIINSNNFDIVVGVSGYYSMLLSTIKDKLNCKVWGWQHNCYEAYFQTKNKYYWHQDKIFLKYLKCLDKYIVLTNSDKEKIKRAYNIDATVINNPRSFDSSLKTLLDNKSFISIGRMVPAKGYDLLFESFSYFCQKNNDWKLIIVGDGPEKGKIVKLIKYYNLEDRVILHGYTNNVQKYLLNSSVFVFPSRWEGFGLVVLEAFEMGLPVIAYDLDPIREIITPFKDGLIASKYDTRQFADKMIELISNTSKLKQYSKNAQAKSNCFSSSKIIEKWIKEMNNNIKR